MEQLWEVEFRSIVTGCLNDINTSEDTLFHITWSANDGMLDFMADIMETKNQSSTMREVHIMFLNRSLRNWTRTSEKGDPIPLCREAIEDMDNPTLEQTVRAILRSSGRLL